MKQMAKFFELKKQSPYSHERGDSNKICVKFIILPSTGCCELYLDMLVYTT